VVCVFVMPNGSSSCATIGRESPCEWQGGPGDERPVRLVLAGLPYTVTRAGSIRLFTTKPRPLCLLLAYTFTSTYTNDMDSLSAIADKCPYKVVAMAEGNRPFP